MSAESFLREVMDRFGSAQGRAIISAFRNERLVWKEIEQGNRINGFLQFAQSDPALWQPGVLAAFVVDPDLPHQNLRDSMVEIPQAIKDKASKTLETIRLTGLEPSSLEEAGLMALSLRQFYLAKQSWAEAAEFLATPRNNLNLWQAAFACAPALLPQFADLVQELLQSTPPTLVPKTTELIVHAVECTPTDADARFQDLANAFEHANLDFQRFCLQILEKYENKRFIERLAANFLAANEQIEEKAALTPKLAISTPYNTVQELQKIAFLNRAAGQKEAALEAIQKAFEALNANQAQLMRELAFELEKTDPEEARKTWEEVLRLAPNEPTYKEEYAEFLLLHEDEEQALDLLNQLPDSPNKTLLCLRYPHLRGRLNLNGDSLKEISAAPISSIKETSRLVQQGDYLRAAQFAFENKQYTLAEDLITKALEEDPNDVDTLRLAGEIYRHTADIDAAIQSSVLVSLYEPEDRNNQIALANLFLQTQQPEKAYEIYHQIISSDPEPKRTNLLTYADVAIKAGKPEVAIPICENFLARDILDGEALVTLCNAYIQIGEEETAIKLLEQTSAIAPEKPDSWLALARIWTKLSQTDKAMESLRKAKEALPPHREILTELGKLYLENDKPTEAIGVLKQAYQLAPDDAQVRLLLAKAFLAHGYLNEAWSVLRPLENDYTSDPDLAQTLGKILFEIGDLSSAQPMLRFAWQASRKDEALKDYVRLLLAQQDLSSQPKTMVQKELSALQSAVCERASRESNAFDFKVLAADIDFAQGKIEAAYQAYLELLNQPEAKAPQTYYHVQHQLGRSALILRDYDTSLSALQEALMVNPTDLRVRHTLAEAYIAAGSRSEGLAAARAALQLAPTDLENMLWYSDFCTRNRNERDAIQLLKDTLHLLPDERALYLALARTYLAAGEPEEAKQTLSRMLATEGISTEEYVNVANIYLHMNDSAEASKIIKKAIANNPSPDFAETRDLVISILRLGDAAAAMQLLSELEGELGAHPAYPLLKSDTLAANKRFIPALQELEGLLREVEFASEVLPFESFTSTDQGQDIIEYSKAGVYYRAAQLERITGDLAAAYKHAAQACSLQPEKLSYLLLKAELDFSLLKSEKLETILDSLGQAEDAAARQAITHLLATHTLWQQDEGKISLLMEHFLSREPQTPVYFACRAFTAWQQRQQAEAQTHLLAGEQLLNDLTINSALQSFSIPMHFAWVWQAFALALAAWECQAWELANKCFEYALSEAKTNPVINQALADYLVEKARVSANAETLHILTHKPAPYSPEKSDQEVHEEQISIAGRYLSAAEMLPALKIGQAVFTSRWDNEDELKADIKTSRQAAQVLSVQLSDEAIDTICAAFPEDFEVQFQAALQILYRNPDLCAEKAAALLAKAPKNPCLYALQALANQAEPEIATEAMEKALEIWPDEPDWHAIAGALYEQQERYDEAAQHLEEALRIQPKQAHYWQMLGDIKVLEKDYHAARDYFSKAIELFPDNAEALSALAVINQQLGEYQAAIACLKQAEQLDPENKLYAQQIAECYLALKDYNAALEQAESALQADPRSVSALLTKIKALIGKRQYDQARSNLQAARKLVTDTIPFDLLEIELESTVSKKSGLGACLALAEAYPDNVDVLNNLAYYYLEAGMQNQAEETLYRSLAIDPHNAYTLLSLGRIDRKRGNLDQALAHLSQAVAINPSLIEAYLEMGKTYQDRRDVEKALETYHRAIDMVEKDPRAYVLAAAAYKESRDYQNAEYMLRQAAELSPNDPIIRRQLASIVALNLVNNLQEAPKRR